MKAHCPLFHGAVAERFSPLCFIIASVHFESEVLLYRLLREHREEMEEDEVNSPNPRCRHEYTCMRVTRIQRPPAPSLPDM